MIVANTYLTLANLLWPIYTPPTNANFKVILEACTGARFSN